MAPRSATLRTLVAVTLGVAAAVYVTTSSAAVADLCYLGPLIAAAIGAWIGAERGPREGRLVPRLIAIGLSLSALGDVLWTVVDRAGGNTDLSVADPAWLLSYAFLGSALWIVLARSRPAGGVDLDFVVDALTIAVVSLLVFWRISIADIVADSTASALDRVTWATYPVLDAFLFALVVRVLLSPRARAAIDPWLAVGVVLWLGADVGYLVVDDHDASMVLDVAWMVAPALIATAAWRGGHRIDEADRPTSARWISQLVVAVCPLLVPPALELSADLRDQPDQPLQLFVGTILLIVLAFVRTGRLLISEDRSRRELALARDHALAASEAKSMFLANMSHELRTPLTTVLAASELLEDTPMTEPQLRLLARMQRAGQRLMTLLESLLDFSRVEAGQVTLQSVDFDLAEVLDDIVAGRLADAQARSVELSREIHPDLPRSVTGDPVRVAQVIGNLVDNAVKFTHEGRVSVEARPADDDRCVRITVTDTGIGIRESDQVSVFSSFTQVDGSATRRYEGSGLGLAICKELIDLMGGSISLASEVGRGSTFDVVLPLRVPQRVGAA
ncbi:sensor histidine kinase [Nocardioides mangrovi]|uniref:histidine kinase n=1 Tax=Nocardioides mangrovi TaxID=2874580 RepID=A0ABS7UGD8_9ACTN|nr:ATP-binding protein [Nocardioides mangrovi]MBZ5739832.1 hypothetical protein [Nocardioides mangrovi]